jgi:GTPase SAR1 family protein
MGVVFEMCNCSSQQPIVPNSNAMVENDMNNLYNPNINTNKNITNNNIENIKKKKKTSNGVINNEQSNEAETYKNISSNGAAVLTPKQKRESIYSQKLTKNKKSVKDSEKKSNKAKSKKSQENINEKEEDFENVNISETVLSELIINDKIKPIQKDKKKKIKGRNNINIVIIGYNEVGKSSFCLRFINNKFEDFYIPSICNENFSKMMIYNDHNYKLNFSVILGGKKIQMQDNNIMNIADFFLIIYDITKIRSFNQINIYLKQLKKSLFSYDKEGKNLNFFLIGNKSDLEGERKVGIEFVNKYIKKYNISHFEISAKTGKNVSNIISSFLQIFDKLAYSSK